MKNQAYTGVGSRETPPEVQKKFTEIAALLESSGYILRSGHADGADLAFELGVIDKNSKAQIFLAQDATPEAMEIASKIHPAWHNCSEYAKKLHARNVFQVLGQDLVSPSKFLLCWTKGGKPVGGTRTAIILAEQNNIPVFNFFNYEKTLAEFIKFLELHSL